MLTTLHRVAVALALLLPTAAYAEPPPEGAVMTLDRPFHVCRDREDAVALSQTPAGPLYSDAFGVLQEADRCGLRMFRGAFMIGDRHHAGPDAGVDYWAVELRSPNPERPGAAWIIWGEPVDEAEPTGLDI